jgi:cytochrome c oxidase subunit 3
MNTTALRPWDRGAASDRAAETGLWLFMAVVATLFMLFLAAYAMRMDTDDWTSIVMPGQLWLSTALLLVGGVTMQRAASAARALHLARARGLLRLGGAAAVAFLASQLWAWQSLLDQRVGLSGNPAASFFYLLTALHGLHVIGGLLAWGAVAQAAAASPATEPRRIALLITLCARYWHLLFVVWVVLFAALGWLTPEVVRFICGRG